MLRNEPGCPGYLRTIDLPDDTRRANAAISAQNVVTNRAYHLAFPCGERAGGGAASNEFLNGNCALRRRERRHQPVPVATPHGPCRPPQPSGWIGEPRKSRQRLFHCADDAHAFATPRAIRLQYGR